jgi:DNA-binding NarL/FixJ family response regulator
MTDDEPVMTLQAGAGPIRVLCVDDHVIIGMAMRATIDAAPDMTCVECLERADMLVNTVAELQPDVVLLDLNMPGKEPLAVVRELVRDYPDVAIIVLSGSSDAETRDAALKAGAWRFLLKGRSGKTILATIRAAVARRG